MYPTHRGPQYTRLITGVDVSKNHMPTAQPLQRYVDMFNDHAQTSIVEVYFILLRMNSRSDTERGFFIHHKNMLITADREECTP